MLVQIDDRSGEVLGDAVTELMSLGARNVQLLSSHTKKGRPGCLMLIDLDESLEQQVAVFIAAELGAWGYHVVQSDHRHFEVEQHDRTVTVWCGESSQRFPLPCKYFLHEGALLRVKVERRDVEAVHRYVCLTDAACSTDTVRSRLEHEVRTHPSDAELSVRFC